MIRAFQFDVRALLLVSLSFGLGAQERPNLIVIMADDLGWGELGSYGQPVIKTPHLDRMAAEGMRFTQAYAGLSLRHS